MRRAGHGSPHPPGSASPNRSPWCRPARPATCPPPSSAANVTPASTTPGDQPASTARTSSTDATDLDHTCTRPSTATAAASPKRDRSGAVSTATVHNLGGTAAAVTSAADQPGGHSACTSPICGHTFRYCSANPDWPAFTARNAARSADHNGDAARHTSGSAKSASGAADHSSSNVR